MELFKPPVFCIAITVAFFASFNTYAKEMDAQLYLNQQLASKPILKYSKPISIITKVCNTTTVRDKCRIGGGGRPVREVGGCEPSYTEKTVCNDVATPSTQEYESVPVVKSTQIQEVRGLKFDESRIVSFPEQGIFDSFYYENCDNFTFKEKATLTLVGKKGFSVTKVNSVSTTKAGEVSLFGEFSANAKIITAKASASTKLSISRTINASNTVIDSESTDVIRDRSREFTLLPYMVGHLEVMAYQVTVEVPFSANVIVDGELAANENGLRLASELLSEDERTLPFSGVLRITDVSKETLRTVPAPKSEQCEALAEKRLLNLEPSTAIPSKLLSPVIKSRFINSKLLLSETRKIAKNRLPLQRSYDGPVIRAANGIGYEIISVSDFSKPEPLCGFNDLGFLNLGIYSLETRQYTNYDNGVLLSAWTDKIETFKSCWPI